MMAVVVVMMVMMVATCRGSCRCSAGGRGGFFLGGRGGCGSQ